MTEPIVNVTNRVYNIEVTKKDNQVIVSSPGPQGVPGQGIPVGGTAGQVLAKINGDNYNTVWVNQTGGETNVTSPITNSGTLRNPNIGINDTNFVKTNRANTIVSPSPFSTPLTITGTTEQETINIIELHTIQNNVLIIKSDVEIASKLREGEVIHFTGIDSTGDFVFNNKNVYVFGYVDDNTIRVYFDEDFNYDSAVLTEDSVFVHTIGQSHPLQIWRDADQNNEQVAAVDSGGKVIGSGGYFGARFKDVVPLQVQGTSSELIKEIISFSPVLTEEERNSLNPTTLTSGFSLEVIGTIWYLNLPEGFNKGSLVNGQKVKFYGFSNELFNNRNDIFINGIPPFNAVCLNIPNIDIDENPGIIQSSSVKIFPPQYEALGNYTITISDTRGVSSSRPFIITGIDNQSGPYNFNQTVTINNLNSNGTGSVTLSVPDDPSLMGYPIVGPLSRVTTDAVHGTNLQEWKLDDNTTLSYIDKDGKFHGDIPGYAKLNSDNYFTGDQTFQGTLNFNGYYTNFNGYWANFQTNTTIDPNNTYQTSLSVYRKNFIRSRIFDLKVNTDLSGNENVGGSYFSIVIPEIYPGALPSHLTIYMESSDNNYPDIYKSQFEVKNSSYIGGGTRVVFSMTDTLIPPISTYQSYVAYNNSGTNHDIFNVLGLGGYRLFGVNSDGIIYGNGSLIYNIDPLNFSYSIPVSKGGTGLSSIGTANQVLKVNANADGLEWGSIDSLPTQSGNNGKFLQTDGSIASWQTLPVIPTNISEFTNDVGYITSSALSPYAPLSGATFTGDIAVNGGDITTNQTIATLFNSNATTINIGAEAHTVSIGDILHNGTTTIQNNLYVAGDITFGGEATTLSATNLEITDSLIYLSVENTADIIDIGFVGAYVNNSNHLHTGLARDASDGKWKLFSNISTEPTTYVDFNNATYDTLKIGALELITALPVSQGGTGQTSFASGKVLVGNGSGALTTLDVTSNSPYGIGKIIATPANNLDGLTLPKYTTIGSGTIGTASLGFYSSNFNFSYLKANDLTGSGGIIISLPPQSGTLARTIDDISGNASTATKLQTARTINNTPFDGSANIIINIDGGTA